MNGFLVFYLVVSYIANIIFCGWLASEKNRNVITWVILGAILPGLAIIAIAGAMKGEYASVGGGTGYQSTGSMKGYDKLNE